MNPTMQIFTRALLTPDLALRTLGEARAATGPDGMPRLTRTTRFAEAEIAWHDRRWLLSMPLSAAATADLERTVSRIRKLNTPWLTPYRLLPDELRWTDPTDRERFCDLVLQQLPEGIPFGEALYQEPADRLLAALDALQEGLRELDFAHNNLRADNLLWTGGRFVPLRYHDARFGMPERDAAAFEALRREIADHADPMRVSDAAGTYEAADRWPGHLWSSHAFEGLVCVEDAGGYGFVDTENRVVIPAQFLWAGDFHEGRAEVETANGMGLIDRTGRYVLPPEYEIVSYDAAESTVRVRQHGLWATFDILGRRLTEWAAPTEPVEA